MSPNGCTCTTTSPSTQGGLIDGPGMTLDGRALESVGVSFFLPAACFVVIAIDGFLAGRLERKLLRAAAP